MEELLLESQHLQRLQHVSINIINFIADAAYT